MKPIIKFFQTIFKSLEYLSEFPPYLFPICVLVSTVPWGFILKIFNCPPKIQVAGTIFQLTGTAGIFVNLALAFIKSKQRRERRTERNEDLRRNSFLPLIRIHVPHTARQIRLVTNSKRNSVIHSQITDNLKMKEES